MPSSVTSPTTINLSVSSPVTEAPAAGIMGRRTVTTSEQSELTPGLIGSGADSSKILTRQARSVTSPTGLSLTDQSNLAILSTMESSHIYQGILAIEGLQELSEFAELLSHTHHWSEPNIISTIKHRASELWPDNMMDEKPPTSLG